MSTIRQDFDRIALASAASPKGEIHNEHYHNFLLRHLPSNCHNVLEIGCGTGTFARRLAEHFDHVLALDLSPEMIRIARERTSSSIDSNIDFPNGRSKVRGWEGGLSEVCPRSSAASHRWRSDRLTDPCLSSPKKPEFEVADILERPLPVASFDCIATIATLHHLPYAEMLLKMKEALKPGGVLFVLDLFEPARISHSLTAGLSDSLLNLLALPMSVGLRVLHHGRLLPRREVRDAWAAHEAHDQYPTMSVVRTHCARILPGAKIKQHLLWRYSIVWEKAR
jgi:ubiquinone/menaquinone biosynthesis C-methylase UbiE